MISTCDNLNTDGIECEQNQTLIDEFYSGITVDMYKSNF